MQLSETALRDRKRELRTLSIAARTAARAVVGRTAPEAAVASKLAAAGLLDEASVVSAYLAIGDEIDACAVLAATSARARLALPVMIAKGQPLEFRLWSPGDPLVERMWGIREPSTTAERVEPDVLLVPLLAFDAGCHRLGYGGGFFDRTLHRLRSLKSVRAIGLAFDEVEVDSVPHAAYDEPLDHVVTPTRLVTRHKL